MNYNGLKAAIVGRGYSQTDFIKKIGMTKKEWYGRMSGAVSFKQKDISIIASVLQLSPAEICDIFLQKKFPKGNRQKKQKEEKEMKKNAWSGRNIYILRLAFPWWKGAHQ